MGVHRIVNVEQVILEHDVKRVCSYNHIFSSLLLFLLILTCTDIIEIDGCTSSPCQNNGKCFALTGMDYFCICPQFVTGKQCQIYNPCANFGCLNGGTCFINTQNQAECACKNSFTGKNCETCK